VAKQYEVRKTDQVIGGDTEVWTVRMVASEPVNVWRTPDGTCRCVRCSGPLTAMSATCPHARAVKRAAGVPPSAAPERVEIGRLVLPATNDEWGEPEIDAFMGRLEALQERIQKGNGRMELAVFVEVPAVGVPGTFNYQGENHG
jgi:hypothetical protein